MPDTPKTMTEIDPSARSVGKRRSGWLTNLLLILAVFVGVQWWTARPLATGAAPALIGHTLDGAAFDLKDLRGQPVLVHFWATWCPVCKLGNSAIDMIAKDHRVVTVAMQSGSATFIDRFLNEEGLSFPVVPDESGAIASRWGVPGVPATFIIGADGQIVSATMGLSTETGLRARLWATPKP
ncbi:MAG TPA: protein disulfide oxidoreductase [Lamprocystis sp. (in: g-proteobacteria)]|nr:protein disulfide oxidoreductase [Lamprocystis sp. (in: g-proteobacteria)]